MKPGCFALALLLLFLAGCSTVSQAIPQDAKDVIAYAILSPVVALVYVGELINPASHGPGIGRSMAVPSERGGGGGSSTFPSPLPETSWQRRDLGRVDFYDKHGNRLGYGIERPGGSWDFFDRKSNRIGRAR